jgi:hypothetical protein
VVCERASQPDGVGPRDPPRCPADHSRRYILGPLSIYDGGQTWRRRQKTHPGSPRAIAIAPSARRIAYAATHSNDLWRSDDGGRTWKRTGMADFEATFSVAVHPSRPETVWAGAFQPGLLRSTDAGRTWRVTSLGNHAQVNSILVDPRRPRVLYAAISDGGVWKSPDGGLTWRPRRNGLALDSGWGLALDRRGTVYAGGANRDGDGGVFKSFNRARTWSRIDPQGLTTTGVASLALSRGGRLLYAGTFGGCVFMRRLR